MVTPVAHVETGAVQSARAPAGAPAANGAPVVAVLDSRAPGSRARAGVHSRSQPRAARGGARNTGRGCSAAVGVGRAWGNSAARTKRRTVPCATPSVRLMRMIGSPAACRRRTSSYTARHRAAEAALRSRSSAVFGKARSRRTDDDAAVTAPGGVASPDMGADAGVTWSPGKRRSRGYTLMSQRSAMSCPLTRRCQRSATWSACGAAVVGARAYSVDRSRDRSRAITATAGRRRSQAASVCEVRSGRRSTM